MGENDKRGAACTESGSFPGNAEDGLALPKGLNDWGCGQRRDGLCVEISSEGAKLCRTRLIRRM
jgi:hypothetical protein